MQVPTASEIRSVFNSGKLFVFTLKNKKGKVIDVHRLDKIGGVRACVTFDRLLSASGVFVCRGIPTRGGMYVTWHDVGVYDPRVPLIYYYTLLIAIIKPLPYERARVLV